MKAFSEWGMLVLPFGKQIHRLHTLSKGMPYFFRIEGEMRVILCLRKASHIWELPEKNPGRQQKDLLVHIRSLHIYINSGHFACFLPLAKRSNLLPCSGGTQYLHTDEKWPYESKWNNNWGIRSEISIQVSELPMNGVFWFAKLFTWMINRPFRTF